MAPTGSLCFSFDKFTDYIRENRLDLYVVLATLSSEFKVGTMLKTPHELRRFWVPKSQLNPCTSQISRWSSRLGSRALREWGCTGQGMAAGAVTTSAVVFEGFYDWTIIVQALEQAHSPENCSCKR